MMELFWKSVVLSYQMKYSVTTQPSNCILGHYSHRNENAGSQKNLCKNVHSGITSYTHN